METSTIVAITLGTTLPLLALLLAVISYKKFKAKTTTVVEPQRVDENPVYGLYYTPDGHKIDNEEIEVKDTCDYYD